MILLRLDLVILKRCLSSKENRRTGKWMNGIRCINRRREWDQELNIKKPLSRHLLLCLDEESDRCSRHNRWLKGHQTRRSPTIHSGLMHNGVGRLGR